MLDSLRAWIAAGLKLYQARLNLALTELQEETERMRRAVVFWALAGSFFLLGLMVMTALIAYLLASRISLGWALALLAVVYLGIAGAIYAVMRKERKTRPAVFASTFAEFDKDADCLCALIQKHEDTDPAEPRAKSRITTPLL